MEKIQTPRVEFKKGERPNAAQLIMEPLYPGYGTTVGSALRRILLSSLPGAAVTAVKIKNAPHEFTTIPKVKEDVLNIILNLKQLRLKVFSDEPVTLTIKAKGEKMVKAGDIEKNSDVEIVNPDLLIATLTSKDAELEMELTVERGRGYMPTETREKQRRDIGVVAIDALFAPIRRVSLNVEPARVGQMTNFDRLIMDIETDGTISPEEAVTESAKLLMDHFSLLNGMPTTAAADETVEETPTVEAESDEEVAEKKKSKKTKKSADSE
jgi:DNA-directed RNA polymerase subunit alpha